MLEHLNKDEIDKLGNAIIFFSNKFPNLSKTSILKLIYLTEEYCVIKYGIPMFNLDYKVWQMGPVNVSLYFELTNDEGLKLLKDYIKIEINSTGYRFIKAIKEFSSDEFSSNDISVLEYIATEYKGWNANELIERCHENDTEWYRIAKENGLLEMFENESLATSDFKIELNKLVENDPLKSATFESYIEFKEFSKNMKQ